ncbi:YbaL family putative K(+) efflux transporter [Sandaracinobacteroides hominis]|uniref:YbaL family putative K(+) efflux transporter n=1 Tax=Sandaracinobacteroides hominis TaxID=2780086 RepID=UPI0018F62445|nr:YbaL family putative K(+) efflux transporter [Sandaracinobacteroides hominis]
MPHDTPLIATIAAGLGLAFLLGLIAHRLKVSPLVGYLLAGIAVGPFTPGFVADQGMANQLSEIGVILLMFGVGLHFSLKDLLSVRHIAIPGALVQMATATAMGFGLGHVFGWDWKASLVFGLALSVASTVVLLRALQDRRIMETERGRIAVGWLIVEDLAMVLALVLLPVLAATGANAASGAGQALGLTLAKMVGFVVFMLVVGKRVIPMVLHYVAHTGSRELFRLAVLAIALGVAFSAASLFGVSFALGAFFAGMILAESQLSQRAAAETLPLRDAFAVLFFVSVGMLFDPLVVTEQPLQLLGTVAVIVVGKSIIAFVLIRAFGHTTKTALTVSASLAQIGEFSFILAALGVSLAILPPEGRDLILAASIISIMLNPLVFGALGPFIATPAVSVPQVEETQPDTDLVPTAKSAHSIVVGHGRVGKALAAGLTAAGEAVLVVDTSADRIREVLADGTEGLVGIASDPAVLQAAGIGRARHLFVAIPNSFEAGQVVEQARAANADLDIVARAHSDEEVLYLQKHGANGIVMGERELARGMLDHALTPEIFHEAAAGAAGSGERMGPRASVGVGVEG